jgi:metal-sulfur cluster biosynthetic enzyme
MTEARHDHTPEEPGPSLAERIWAVLGETYDPCCRDRGVSVVDLGLVKDVHVAGGEVQIELLLTTGWCPFAIHLVTAIEERVRQCPGVSSAVARIVWDPVWTPDRMAPAARERLQLPLADLIPQPLGAGQASAKEEAR